MSGRYPSQERLLELFVYKDGILFKRINRCGTSILRC